MMVTIIRTISNILAVSGVGADSKDDSVQKSFAASSKETQASKTLPKDINPESGYRLPLPKREDLDDYGKKVFDRLADPDRRKLAGLRGPSGIRLHSPKLAETANALSHYLRYESGLIGRVRELAILVTAREMDNQFEWAAHEPAALEEGITQETIDIIKYRKNTAGLTETEAVIIDLGRQMFGRKNVTSETFARALKIFGPRKLVDLVSLMANYSATAVLLCVFDMQLLPDKEPRLPLP